MADGLLRTADEFRAGYRDTLGNVSGMVETLDERTSALPTGCPGWSVRDLVTHVSHLETLLLGGEHPAHEIPQGLAHVRTPQAEFMEVGVDYRRTWPLQRVLDEYREITQRRLADLETVRDDMLEQDAPFAFGPSKLRNNLTIRIFDIWSHEQDMRRALGQPDGFGGAAGGHSRELLARGVGRRAAERVAPPEGSTLFMDITGAGGAQRTVEFSQGKGRVVEGARESPTVTMRLDMNTLTVLGCGRADDPGARDRVQLDGDVDLGRRILEDVAFTP